MGPYSIMPWFLYFFQRLAANFSSAKAFLIALTTIKRRALLAVNEERTRAAAMQRFLGRVSLVTGGAKGIGAAICQRLASEGSKVIVVDHDEACGLQTANDLTGSGHSVRFIHADVSGK